MNTRAGNLIFAAAFVSSLFGSQALPNGVGGWDAAALGCLVALGVVIVLMLWPYAQYRFRFDPEELLKQYVDSERQATLAQMHRELALQIERDRQGNWRIMQRLRRSLQLALILFLLEILSWLMSLAGY